MPNNISLSTIFFFNLRLNNDLKQFISVKSKKLAAEIKLVNSMQIFDTEKVIYKDKIDVQKLDINNALEENPYKEQSSQKVSIAASTSEIENEKTEKENSRSKTPSAQELDQNLSIHNESTDNVLIKEQTKKWSPHSEVISLDNVLTKEQTKHCSQHSEEITLAICVESNDKISFCGNDDGIPYLEKTGDPEHVMELAKKNNEVRVL